jgi:MFS family permease
MFPMARPEISKPAGLETPSSSLIKDRVLWLLLAATIGVGLIFAQVISTYGPYLHQDHGLTEAQIGRLIAVNCLLIVLFQMPLTHLVERFSGARVTALGALFLGLGFLLMPFGHGLAFLVFTAVVWAFGEMLTLPTLATLTSFRAPTHQIGRVMGLHSLAFSIGIILGPIQGSRILQARGGLALWSSVAIIAVVVALMMLTVSGRKRT